MYPRGTHYIAAFLRRHWQPCKAWEPATILAWVQWFIDHDRCLVVTSKRRIISVTLYRMVHTPDEIRNPYGDSNGPVAYIEVTASTSKGGMKGCYNLLRKAVGHLCTHICWVRAKYKNRFSIITINDAERHLIYG